MLTTHGKPMKRQHTYRQVATTLRPVSVSNLRAHMQMPETGDAVADAEEDSLIEGFVDAAVFMFQKETGLVLMAETWQVVFNYWDAEGFALPLSPVNSVDSFVYFDADDVEQTLPTDDYSLMPQSLSPRVLVKSPKVIKAKENAVTITVQAGYANTESNAQVSKIPGNALLAIKILATHYYNNRELSGAMQQYDVPASYQCIVNMLRVCL